MIKISEPNVSPTISGQNFRPVYGNSTPSTSNTIKPYRTDSAPQIDGQLDDSCWENAAVVSGFTQAYINWNTPATEETTVQICYDEENIYFGIRSFDSEPDIINANISNRDEIFSDDYIAIVLDTFKTKKSGFLLGVNPYGIQVDGIYDENNRLDISWDTVFASQGSIDSQGWSVEIALPFKSLRFPDKDIQSWGILVGRSIARKGEVSTWPALDPKISCEIQQGGTMEGIEIKPTHIFGLIPYFAGGYQEELNQATSNLNGQEHFDAGIDLKYGLSSNLIMDLTLNPDFSQVEADSDQIEINRRYELYFPEKRAFFLEGNEKFASPIDVFYSRRIADPLIGGKFTGKFGPFNFGLISSWDEGIADLPDALFNILRTQLEFGTRSNIGLIITDKEYKGESAHLFNRLAGLDSQLHFLDYYTVILQTLYSWTATERESRINETHDPAFYAKFERDDGSLTASLSYLDIFPDFAAEAGFIPRTDIREFIGQTKYIFLPETWLRSLTPNTTQKVIFDNENNLVERTHGFGVNFDFEGKNLLGIRYKHEAETWRATEYLKNVFSFFFQNDLINLISGGISFQTGDSIYYDQDFRLDPADSDDSFLGWNYSLSLWSTIKPASNLSIELTAVWENFRTEIDGDELYNVWLLRGKINYQIISSLFVRVIAQGNTFDESLGLSALLGYVPSPGTAIYLGYNEDIQFADDAFSTGRTIFGKLSYNWQY